MQSITLSISVFYPIKHNPHLLHGTVVVRSLIQLASHGALPTKLAWHGKFADALAAVVATVAVSHIIIYRVRTAGVDFLSPSYMDLGFFKIRKQYFKVS